MNAAIIQTNSKLDLVLERVVDFREGIPMGGMDETRTHQEMVHACAVDDRQ